MRQMKYCFTRGKNQKVEDQSGKKVTNVRSLKECASSRNLSREGPKERAETNTEVVQRSSKSSAIVSDNTSKWILSQMKSVKKSAETLAKKSLIQNDKIDKYNYVLNNRENT
jgi:hypothetical protein